MPVAKPSVRSDPEPSGDQQSAPKAVGAAPEAGEGQLDAGDISLIRSMLERTPTERLERLQDFANGVMALRDGRIDREPVS